MKAKNKRHIRHLRVRKKVFGSTERPRLAVFRSNKYIYAQIIDDTAHKTLVSESDQKMDLKVNKAQRAFEVGKSIAQKAIKGSIKEVVFDRGGYLYHGRIAKLAEGAREGGLKF